MNVMAGSWLMASVWTLRMTHRSSTIFAVHGSVSQTSVPASPWRAKSNFEGAMGKRV